MVKDRRIALSFQKRQPIRTIIRRMSGSIGKTARQLKQDKIRIQHDWARLQNTKMCIMDLPHLCRRTHQLRAYTIQGAFLKNIWEGHIPKYICFCWRSVIEVLVQYLLESVQAVVVLQMVLLHAILFINYSFERLSYHERETSVKAMLMVTYLQRKCVLTEKLKVGLSLFLFYNSFINQIMFLFACFEKIK